MPDETSLLRFYYQSLGIVPLLLLLVSGAIGFVGTHFFIFRQTGNIAATGMILSAFLPWYVGLGLACNSSIASMYMLAGSCQDPKACEYADFFSRDLVPCLVGLVLSAPSFFLVIFASIIRVSMPNDEFPE